MNSPIMRWILVIVWMGVIFAFSHQANSSEKTAVVFGGFNIFARKLGHISEFGALYLLLRQALRKHIDIKKATYLAVLLAILYAASDEWHQSFVPGRSACVEDVMLDSSAVLVAFFCTGWIDKIFEKLKGARN
ncbi:MAG: VanZ family protein [Candidatus Melainabacteria bacterium]|nr:MAG: VanZ family protein [Candidatus Melainabacteria bacterium]